MRSLLSMLAFFALIAAQVLAVIAAPRARLGERVRESQATDGEAAAANDGCPPTSISVRQASVMQVEPAEQPGGRGALRRESAEFRTPG